MGYAGVDIPDYVCDNPDAEISQPDVDNYPTMYIISNSNADEMDAFAASFSSNWEDQVDSYGDHHLYFGGELQPGESCPYIYLGDYTQESFAGIMVQFSLYTEPVPAAAFPFEEVNAFLEEYSLGFTLSTDLEFPGTGFLTDSGESGGYHLFLVGISGNYVSEVDDVLGPVVLAAGYVLYEDVDYIDYYNADYHEVQIKYNEAYTLIYFWE